MVTQAIVHRIYLILHHCLYNLLAFLQIVEELVCIIFSRDVKTQLRGAQHGVVWRPDLVTLSGKHNTFLLRGADDPVFITHDGTIVEAHVVLSEGKSLLEPFNRHSILV